MEWSLVVTIATILVTIVSAVWSLQGWLNRQFISVRDRIDKTTAIMLDKLEYHERHDDQRFNAVYNDIWAIRLRNAAIDKNKIIDPQTQITSTLG